MRRYRAIAEYYDPENVRHKMLQHDVPFFLGQMPKTRQTVLELATGTGRAAIPIAQAGHRVIGVDYAKDMLEIARRKRDGVGLRERDYSLVHGDMLSPELGRRFDWVCVFFNTFLSFTTLTEQDRALQAIRRHLKPKGRFWLDVFNPDLALLAKEVRTNMDPCTFYVPRYDRTVFSTTEVRWTTRPQVQRVTFRYKWFDADGAEHWQRTEFDLTYLFPREIHLLMERNGLRVERMFGNYDGSDVTPTSPRLIARCCRI